MISGVPAGKGGAAEIIILVFGLGGPVRREHVFEAGADGIAVRVVAGGGERYRRSGGADADIAVVAPGVAALGVEQCRPPSVAEPAGDRAELVGIGGDQSARRKQHAIIVAVREPVVLGLGTDHPVRRELVVEAALHAAHEPGVCCLPGCCCPRTRRRHGRRCRSRSNCRPLPAAYRPEPSYRSARACPPRAREPRSAINAAVPSKSFFMIDSPFLSCIDINQTTWPQFGCFAAMPEHTSLATVTTRQQRPFVPCQFGFLSVFCP